LAVPDFQSFMQPLLRLVADKKEHTSSELRERLASEMGLTQSDLEERLPSGTQTKYGHRIQWAVVYLAKAGALQRAARGVVVITDRGLQLLSAGHQRITNKIVAPVSRV
jgi:restriction system protein